MRAVKVTFSLALAGCFALGCSSETAPPAATPDAGSTDVVTVTDAGVTAKPDVPEAVAALVRARPYQSIVPPQYDPATPMPLVVVLHGYGANGFVQAGYLGLSALARTRGFLLAYPNGTLDTTGRLFWNATDACCDFARTNVDDVAYITAVIDDMSARYRVDARRVFLVGHSNGGFMAHRMACDRPTRIAAFVSLAGAFTNDPMRCTPSAPVAALQVHGTADDVIRYEGGSTVGGPATMYPSARDTVAAWGRLNRCGALAMTSTRLDLETSVMGDETVVSRHESCMGGAAELWAIEGGGHLPTLSATWAASIYDWLSAHPRP